MAECAKNCAISDDNFLSNRNFFGGPFFTHPVYLKSKNNIYLCTPRRSGLVTKSALHRTWFKIKVIVNDKNSAFSEHYCYGANNLQFVPGFRLKTGFLDTGFETRRNF